MGNTMKHFSDWTNNTVVYKEFISQSGAGDIVYASDDVTLSCYISGETVMTTNDKGDQIVSNQQLYFDGSVTGVSTIDFTGIMEVAGRKRPIKSIDPFYDEDGNMDLVVVYL